MRKLAAAWYGAGASVILLIAFFVMQGTRGNALDLPLRWHLTALLPFIAGLAVAGYKITLNLSKGQFEISSDVKALPEIPGQEKQPSSLPKPPPDDWTRAREPDDWTRAREEEYERTDHYMLAHEYRPSQDKPGYYDTFIFVVRHEKRSDDPPRRRLSEIEKAEFFFGASWDNQIFEIRNTGDVLGVRTLAWGTFLATCRITLAGREIILHRYIDFSMAQSADKKIAT